MVPVVTAVCVFDTATVVRFKALGFDQLVGGHGSRFRLVQLWDKLETVWLGVEWLLNHYHYSCLFP